VRAKRAIQVAGALAWFLTGMVLWIGGTLAAQKWAANRVHRASAAVPVKAVPATLPVAPPLEGLYVDAAEKILSEYRESTDPALDDFDWVKAEIFLERAVALGRNDPRTLGELALSRGYATLERLADERYSAAGTAQLRTEARADLTEAAKQMPDSPDPPLALARYYVYAAPDTARAMEEFRAAARAGAAMGRREIEQEADAFRLRAESEAGRQPRQARADAQQALALYGRIPGFDQADAHAGELKRMRYGTAARPPARRRSWR